MNDAGTVFVRIHPRNVHYLNRIFEGYEYLGVVSSIDKRLGIMAIRGTPGTVCEVREVLANLPIEIELLDSGARSPQMDNNR